MANVSLIDPYSQKAEEIANRRRMAQALQEQGSQILDMPTMPGVAISPYAGLAKVLQAGLGAYEDKQARKEYADLQNEYRTNYNTQLGEMARLISAPEVKGVAGTNKIPYEPAQTEKIYGTKPAPVMGSGYGSGMLMPDQVIGEKVIKPEVLYQAAVAPVRGQPAGYISPEALEKFDVPEVKQLLMAKYLKQFEPEQVKLGQNERLLERTGGGPFKELQGVSTTPKAAEPKWEKGVKTVDGKNVYGWYDLTAPNYEASFKPGAVPPADDTKLIEVTRGGKVYLENPAIADTAARQAAAIEKETVPVKKVRMEVTAADGSTKTVLMDETDPRFAEGFVTKGPEWVSITTVNAQGMPEIRQVKKDDAILKTGYVKPLEGFLGQLQAAGVPMDKIQSDPKIRDLVDRYFVKTAGGVAPEDVFGSELRKAEVVARLGELGIAIPANIKGLSLSVTPGVLGGAQSGGGATTAASGTKTAPLPLPPKGKEKDYFKAGNYYQTDKGVLLFNGLKFVE
jgi:hypothetical protein